MIQDGRSQATQAESQLLIGSSMRNWTYYFLSIFKVDNNFDDLLIHKNMVFDLYHGNFQLANLKQKQ